MEMRALLSGVLILTGLTICAAQTTEAFDSDKKSPGLLDPSRLTIHQSASFGMSTSNFSDMKSASIYATMLQYKFSQPLTLNLSFGLPIHSTYDPRFNLTPENLKSAQYFQNMPFDATLTWQPSESMTMQLSVARYTGASNYMTNPSLLRYGRLGMFDHIGLFDQW
jgi:hypothetical protein